MDGFGCLTVVVGGGRFEKLLMSDGAVGAGVQDGDLFQIVGLLDNLAQEVRTIPDMQIGDSGLSLTAQDLRVPLVRQPGLEEHEQRRVLAPVREHGGESDDRRGHLVGVLAQHLFTLTLADRIWMLTVGWALLG